MCALTLRVRQKGILWTRSSDRGECEKQGLVGCNADVSEEYFACIFRIEMQRQAASFPLVLLVSW
jgi:hypothetical protein